MKFILFYLPSVGSYTQVKQGMAGINTQNYQNMLWQISRQAQAADDMGFWGLCFTEHHFHIEGLEESNNPVLLDLYIGMQTQRIMVGQMACVLPFHNPIRLAEDLSMLDQMLRGRSFIGLARGYQRRWAEIYGQIYGVGGTMSDKSEVDKKNRDLFMEHYEILKTAMTQDTFSMKTTHWEIPTSGLDFGHQAVRKYGKGQDDDGVIHEVGIAPKPYQKPMPKMFMPFSFSEETYRFCAREGIVPMALSTNEPLLDSLFGAYHEEAQAAGRGYAYGENIGIFRDVFVQEKAEDAHRYAAQGNGFVWPEWFAPIGFNEALRKKGEEGKIAQQIDYQGLRERNFEFVGTPDDVNRDIEAMVEKYNPEYFLLWQYPGLIPHDAMMRNLELLATEVLPNWVD